jgi:hypothetical protein
MAITFFKSQSAILLVLSFTTSAFGQANQTCPAGKALDDSAINPSSIRSYADANRDKIKDIGDLICCLPKSYRENYVIAHTSKAKQNSVFYSPRVLLFNKLQKSVLEKTAGSSDEGRQPLQSVISINGGDANLEQTNSIEMMFNNPKTHEVEYFDYEHKDGKFHLSGKNPEVCMACHNGGRPVGPGGPRTIFDPPSAWPRFLKGISPCNEGEKALTAALEKASEKTFKENPRFRCLDPKPDGFDPFQGGHFDGVNDISKNAVRPSFLIDNLDQRLADLNDRRNAQIARSTPNYNSYKYAIIGALSCGAFGTMKAQEWLPANVIATHNSDAELLPAVKNSTDLLMTFKTKMKEYAAEDRKLAAKQKKMATEVNAGGHPVIEFSTRPTVCDVPGAGEARTRLMNRGRPTVSSGRFSSVSLPQSLDGPPLLDRFVVDTALRGFRRSSSNAFLRYLFEGRGISIQDWSMDLFENYSRPPSFLVKYLMDAESSNTDLGKLRSDMKAAGMIGDPDQSRPRTGLDGLKKREEICDRLKKLSMEAFSDQAQMIEQPSKQHSVPTKQ